MKKNLKLKTFKARFICHECSSKIEITNVDYFKAHINCPFCGNRMWLHFLKDQDYWTPKAIKIACENEEWKYKHIGEEDE